EKLQEEFAARVRPERVMLPVPGVAPTVPPPVMQVPVAPLGFATTRPPGSVSVTPRFITWVVVSGLVTVNVNEVVPFNGIVEAAKLLVMVGGAMTVAVTVLLVAPAPLSVDEIAPVVFDSTVPGLAVATTSTVIVQPSACRVPPVRVKLPEPGVAVTEP